MGVAILCCPEASIGGLADYVDKSRHIAIDACDGGLERVLSPLASDTVSVIVGFTETDNAGTLYNSAAVMHRGEIVGVYRKMHPAINRSVYRAGSRLSLFRIGNLTFGVLICLDSTVEEHSTDIVSRGATALFIPTNNGMPQLRSTTNLVERRHAQDILCASRNRMSVIRADVAGRANGLVSYGSSGIFNHKGEPLAEATQLEPCLLVADIEPHPI